MSRQRVGYRGVELFGSIVEKACDDFERKYPGSEFHVILWEGHSHHLQEAAIIAELKHRDLRLHLVREIIPELLVAPEPYRLSERNHHPSAQAHRRIANYVTDRIVR